MDIGIILLVVFLVVAMVLYIRNLKNIRKEVDRVMDGMVLIHNLNLTESDLDFLIDLQHEMLTQDHVGQAAPRFWVVAGTRQVETGEEYGDGEQLLCDTDVIAEEMDEAVKHFQELMEDRISDENDYYIVIEKEETSSFNSWRVAKIEKDCNAETVEDYTEGEEIMAEWNFITSMKELVEALEEVGLIRECEYTVGYYRNEHHVYPDTMFLTNRSCKEHIEANHYHYSSDAHSYAMTAWRSPEVSRLFEILDKIDWKMLKEGAYGSNAGTSSEGAE